MKEIDYYFKTKQKKNSVFSDENMRLIEVDGF